MIMIKSEILAGYHIGFFYFKGGCRRGMLVLPS